ncbi:MAG: helix-turn-helix transcriptional regulator [Oscillospiraceae bacterium]|nr:helix-turn-helix transcriptional regulator [Oscillospiraceae bacterium]
MDEFKATVASNLIRLRLASGMTQAELGEKLNYSDKSISKWERGDAVPDAFVLKQIAEIFGVTVDYLLQPHSEIEPVIYTKPGDAVYSTATITLISILGIWTLAVLAFVLFWMGGLIVWHIFIYAVPISLITLLVLQSIWHQGRFNKYIVAFLVFSIVATIYLTFLKHNFWQLFLVTIPAELVVFLCFRIKRPREKA